MVCVPLQSPSAYNIYLLNLRIANINNNEMLERVLKQTWHTKTSTSEVRDITFTPVKAAVQPHQTTQ